MGSEICGGERWLKHWFHQTFHQRSIYPPWDTASWQVRNSCELIRSLLFLICVSVFSLCLLSTDTTEEQTQGMFQQSWNSPRTPEENFCISQEKKTHSFTKGRFSKVGLLRSALLEKSLLAELPLPSLSLACTSFLSSIKIHTNFPPHISALHSSPCIIADSPRWICGGLFWSLSWFLYAPL